MPKTAIVGLGDPARREIEDFISSIYELYYDAVIEDFPSRLLVSRNAEGNILCAAGLRTETDGFFSENYLDQPVDTILSALSKRPVGRHEILEVSTLASLAPKEVSRFIAQIIDFGEANAFAWSFFTATSRLRHIVERLGLSPIRIADADRNRIANFERWGTYYGTEPGVYAVASPRLAAHLRPDREVACDAIAV